MFSSSVTPTLRGLLFLLCAALTGSKLSVAAISARDNQQFPGLIREPLMLQITLPDGQPALLDAFVTRPDGPERWPVALITNGTTGNAAFDRWELNPNRMSGTALAFARHGYAAVVVLREGYGYSSGGAEYTGGTCTHPQHSLARQKDTADLLGALNAIRQQPWASPHTTVLAGMSAGGFGVLAAAAGHPAGVQAIINFDGGRGAAGGGALCDETGLLAAFSAMGRATRIPSLWLYSQNDKLFSPQTGQAFVKAYTSAGGLARFIVMPPYGDNGHVFMDSAPEAFWWPQVADFLRKQGLPVEAKVAVSMKPMPLPHTINNAAGAAAFREYASAQRDEKAFATDDHGDWGIAYWARTTGEAAALAQQHCLKHQQDARQPCAVYAINNNVVAR
ncbi:dienelactone hydrolase family protein [Candidatus Pantoea soli]|uniref:Dienelactone hydrolase n=1 Tax=Candidatus Pantoea soli TaxID=3098669 RepID=A0A518XIH7_9GAMM|nr:CocE/NonD family hydrolase [Pantoea soli]QDY44002.1 dienelactone hydrolase [Pantoea soli]